MASYLRNLQFNWNYYSTPQTTACLGTSSKECLGTRGKGLGGCSMINYLMYVRGNKRDFDIWANQGNPGWSYEEVLPYFKKSENSQIDGDEGYHGKGGYLNVEYHKPNNPHFNAFIEANLELGRKVVDYNGKEQLGVAQTQLNTINGRRDSTGKAFLLPAMDRPNLKILPHSLATKVLIKPLSRKAYGVLFSHEGTLFRAKARKEIIVSAGAIASPQLLMLSGIGPKDHLESHGIPVIHCLPVGDNFQDHATYFGLRFKTNNTEPAKSLEQYVKEYLNGVGLLTIPGNSQGLGFFRTNMSKISGYPDIEIIVNPPNNIDRLCQDSCDTSPTSTFNFALSILHPKSRGTIRLKSNSPYDYPLIDPRFLSDLEGEDIETMYQGIQLALQMINTNAFKKLNTSLIYEPLPACQHYKYFSREFWYCQLRQLVPGIVHAVGTCKMGPGPLTGAVVNHELKVHGIVGLRVADASIIPEITSGHTNAPVIMIGEKVSDMIKNEK